MGENGGGDIGEDGRDCLLQDTVDQGKHFSVIAMKMHSQILIPNLICALQTPFWLQGEEELGACPEVHLWNDGALKKVKAKGTKNSIWDIFGGSPTPGILHLPRETICSPGHSFPPPAPKFGGV